MPPISRSAAQRPGLPTPMRWTIASTAFTTFQTLTTQTRPGQRAAEQEPDVAGGYAYICSCSASRQAGARASWKRHVRQWAPWRAGVLACLRDTHHRTGSRSLRAPLATDGGGTIFGTGLRHRADLLRLYVGLGGRLWARSGGAHIMRVPIARSALAAAVTPQGAVRGVDFFDEFLRLTHGAIDPTMEKLVAEFLSIRLTRFSYTLPPVGPAAAMTRPPAAYPTVIRNAWTCISTGRHEGWVGHLGGHRPGGVQSGMAPTLAALAYQRLARV